MNHFLCQRVVQFSFCLGAVAACNVLYATTDLHPEWAVVLFQVVLISWLWIGSLVLNTQSTPSYLAKAKTWGPLEKKTHCSFRVWAGVRLVSRGTSVWICFSSPFSFTSKVVVYGHCLVMLSFTINETLKWLSLLTILMQKSCWWWQCSDRYVISLSPPTSISPSPSSPYP